MLISIPRKKRYRPMTLRNTLEDFQSLAINLTSYDLPVRIGFEATGNFHRVLAHHLGPAGFESKCVSSADLARTRKALHNSWDKSRAVQFFHDPFATGTTNIQELSKNHEAVSPSKTELWDRILTHYLPRYFPRGRTMSPELENRLVPGLPNEIFNPAYEHGGEPGSIHRRCLESGWK